MNEYGIDVELLIHKVREYPDLWDNTCKFYKNKSFSQDSWIEICTAFQPDFHSLPSEEQQKLKTSLKKKWASIKESWIKWKKESIEKIDPDKALTDIEITAVIRNILFNGESECNCLNDNFNLTNDKSQELDNEPVIKQQTMATESLPPKKFKFVKKKPSNDCDSNEPQSSTKANSNNVDSSKQRQLFFEGIKSSLEDFSENEMLDFQIGVLNVIREIRANRKKIL